MTSRGVSDIAASMKKKSVPKEMPLDVGPHADVPEVSSFDQKAYEEINTLDGESKIEKSDRVLYKIGLAVTIGVIFLAIGIALLWAKTPRVGDRLSQMPTPISSTAIVQPTSAVAPFDRSLIVIDVLNASGVPGAASREAKRVSRLGYTVGNIGNATGDTVGNQLFLSPQVSVYADQILVDFKEHFSIASIAGMVTDSTASARLIVGKK